jgi:hypothetical protein
MYNILGVMKGLNDNAKSEQLNESVNQPTVYENVEPKGSIMNAVKSLAGKFAKFNESAKPDFLDLDKDGDKKEPMKKAAKEKKAKPFSSDDYDEYGVRHSSSFNQPPKKAVKDKNNAKGAFKDMFGGDAKDLTSKLKIKEGQGPYTLDDPKHPKFKANYEKFKKSNPDCKLADFVAAMKKKEATMNEAAYDEPEAPNADAIAKRKRLQALKDRQEDERAERGGSNTNTPIRKVAGKAYGGAAQKDDVSDLDEVAPPGAKAERMVKHIKKGYSKDGNLSKKEKGIAYATAWKAKKAGNLDEGTEFGDTIKNSAPDMKKAKPTKLKESRMIQESDYYYEEIGKALAEDNPNLDTSTGDFEAAVRKEMVARGMKPERARNILLMDEDFLGDVASAYAHYCKELAESSIVPMTAPVSAPIVSNTEELDEIARLAGLPPTVKPAVLEVTELDEAVSRKDFRMVADLIKANPDRAKATELAHHHAGIFAQQNPRFKRDMFLNACGVDTTPEVSVDEGNEFTKARLDAIQSGKDTFVVGGKTHSVSGDVSQEKQQVEEAINVTINASADSADGIHVLQLLAGLQSAELPAEPTVPVAAPEVPVAQEIPVGDEGGEVAEERDIEYVNTPNEKIAPLSAAIPNGTDLHKSKRQDPRTANKAANPLAVEESLWKDYESLISDIKA